MKPLDYITWLWGDIAKDFGGKDPGINRSLADKRAYLLFVTVLTGIVAGGAAVVWWPLSIPPGAVCARKFWIYCTITG